MQEERDRANKLLERVETAMGRNLPPELRDDIWRHLGVIQ